MAENGGINIEKLEISDKVRQKILDASEELFCQKGFDGTTIRDITTSAECNLAAVNYHFQNKEHLYQATFSRHLAELRETYIAAVNNVMSQPKENVTLENLLRSFSTAMVELLIGKSKSQRFITLMTREMLDPHMPANIFYDQMMHPVQMVMHDAIRRVCPKITDKQLMFSMVSLVGQLIHVVRFTEFVERGGIQNATYDINELVEHTVNFSAAGIRAVVSQNQNTEH
jgi:AcrR family transcriptional regulator